MVLGVPPQRVLLPWLAQSHADGTFLGRPARPFNHFYVALEETQGSLKNKLAAWGFSGTVRAAAIDQVRPLTVEGMVKLIPPDTEVLVIGNIGALIENKLASPQRVLVLIPELRALTGEPNLTVVGITGASKSYGGRERIKGSYVWPHFTDTVVILDPGSQPDTVTAKISR